MACPYRSHFDAPYCLFDSVRNPPLTRAVVVRRRAAEYAAVDRIHHEAAYDGIPPHEYALPCAISLVLPLRPVPRHVYGIQSWLLHAAEPRRRVARRRVVLV